MIPGLACPRLIQQPGPAAPARIESAAGRLREATISVPAGMNLVDAIAAPLAALGIRGGGIDLAGLVLGPFAYVMPAPSPDAEHVAFYSRTHRVARVVVESGTATFGSRDGAPFLHAHALWHDGAALAAGHILGIESTVATACELRVWGVAEAEMIATPDAETNFTLFGPAQLDDPPARADCILGRLRPNEDLLAGIEALCRRHGARSAVIRSGIGSTVGSLLENGDRIETDATEFFVRTGRVVPEGDDGMRAEVELVLVDETGRRISGRPVRGMNPVLICAEIILTLT